MAATWVTDSSSDFSDIPGVILVGLVLGVALIVAAIRYMFDKNNKK